MNMDIQELKNLIIESFASKRSTVELDFEGVVEDLPMRTPEDILVLLPYVMCESLSLLETKKKQKLQVLETAIRMFNGLSDCPSMQASAIKLRDIMNPLQRRCMGLWLLLLKDVGAIDYVEDDLIEGTKFWGN